MIVIAGLRFVRTAKDIESDNDVPSPGERFDLGLAVLIGLLGVALFLYLVARGAAGALTPLSIGACAPLRSALKATSRGMPRRKRSRHPTRSDVALRMPRRALRALGVST